MKYSLLEKLIKTPVNIIAIEDHDSAAVLDSLREYYSVTGHPVYIWKKGFGLYRSDLPTVKIPMTQSAEQIVQYMSTNKQDHVFVLSHFNNFIDNFFVINMLRQIARNKEFAGKVVILDNKLDIPERLKRKVLETQKMLKLKNTVIA